MRLRQAFIPYGAYYSTPFCRWQGSLADEHSLEFAATVAREFVKEKVGLLDCLDGLILGTTVPQKSAFYGVPWIAGLIGKPTITGPTLAQACATSARVIAQAALEVESGYRQCVFGVLADRTSNGPHVYYPTSHAPGGRGQAEDWVWDNFGRDPFAKNAMIETAEKVASAERISRAEQDEVTALRHAQYEEALADNGAFQRRYLRSVTVGKKKDARQIHTDEGIAKKDRSMLAAMRPVLEGGTVTGGSQTHPADGHAALVVCGEKMAEDLATDRNVKVQVVSFAEARTDVGMMPKAVVPAAQAALRNAGITSGDVASWKTHNPFAVNDVLLGRALNIPIEHMNRFGSPLVYGHPQAPTGARLIMELIEELVLRGGGYGLFVGCAAGDTAMSVVLRVTSR